MAIRTIKCGVCGSEFQTNRANVKYCCNACRSEASRNYPSRKKYQPEPENVPMSSLAITNQKAREAGMSYGKYVGLQWLKEHKW